MTDDKMQSGRPVPELAGEAFDAASVPSHCVVTVFYGVTDLLAQCISKLLAQATDNTQILLVDDGSPEPGSHDSRMASLLADPRVTVVRHEVNRGISAARNSAIQWCRKQDIEIIIMTDSDCEPPGNFIKEHLALHKGYPDAAVFGARILGKGTGFWAALDGVLSWAHCALYDDIHEVNLLYHIPTANVSFKTAMLPDRSDVFDSRLRTGEDALLTRELRRMGHSVMFSPRPLVHHHDRETFLSVFKHHYEWGHHQYFVQFGGDISPRCFRYSYRIPFAILFVFALPFFAMVGSVLNVLPWLRHKPQNMLFYPFMYLMWLGKGVAVIEAAIRPRSVMRG